MPTLFSISVETVQLVYSGLRFRVGIIPPSGQTSRTLLIIGGIFQTMADWFRVAETLREDTRVVIPELPGFGAADPATPDFGFDCLAAAVEHTAQALAISETAIMGASYGSPIAYRCATRGNLSVTDLILVGVQRQLDADQRSMALLQSLVLKSGRLNDFARVAVQYLVNGNSTLQHKLKRILRRSLENLSADDVAKAIDNLERVVTASPLEITSNGIPRSLVFTGENDRLTTATSAREFARMIGASFTSVRQASHLPHIENRNSTIGLVRSFLGRKPLEQIEGCSPIEHFASVIDSSLPAVSSCDN